jgi:hypothetical protein
MSPKAKLAALLALFIVPTLLSFVVFYVFPPEKTSNYGTLIAPVIALPAEKMRRLDGGGSDAGDALRGKWLLVTRVAGGCAEQCLARLHAMKQARLILGREQNRVVRVVLIEDDAPPPPALVQEFTGTVWVGAKSSAWKDKLPAGAGGAQERIYAIDPLGNAFMFYGANPDIKRLARDLKQVLRASQIG